MKVEEIYQEMSLYDFRGDIQSVIDMLKQKQQYLEEFVNEEYSNPAGRRGIERIRLSVEPKQWEDEYGICIVFDRDEHPSETVERVRRELQLKDERELRERQEFERLTKKFKSQV